MTRGEKINPGMLSWARETAGLSVKEAAEKLGLKDTAQSSAAEKLIVLEAGDHAPSQSQLLRLASVYRRPLIAFYLPGRPRRGDRGEDFRMVTGSVSASDNGILDALLRDIRARQQMLRDVLEGEDESRSLSFVASAGMALGTKNVAASIRDTLEISVESQKRANGPAALFKILRDATERIGVYVLLLGDAGSYHSDLSEEVFRGFALSDDVAPFIVINDNDAAPARAFTLLHELAHIWIGASGVSGPLNGLSDNKIERFCNDVAGEFLLPAEFIPDLSRLNGSDMQVILRETERLAQLWNVSQAAVTYRFVQNRWIDLCVATALFGMFRDRWLNGKQRARETKRSDDGGPSYYVVRRDRLGAALLGVVRRALQGDTLTHTKAAKILGVKPSSVEALLKEKVRVA